MTDEKKVEIWDKAYTSPKSVRETLLDIYEMGRTNVIDDLENWLHKRILRTIPIDYDELVKVLEQMKEMKNEQM